MNSQHTYSNSLDSEIWSSSPHFHTSSQSFDSWNMGLQRPIVLGTSSPSKLSWEDVGSFGPYQTKTSNKKPIELILDSVEEPSILQQQIISPNNINNDHDLVRSVDQLLLDDGDDGDIFELDMEDNYGYSNNVMGRPPYRRRLPCKFFQNNTCKAGNKCRFSHDLSPQQVPQQPSIQQPQLGHSPMRNTSLLSTSPQYNTPQQSRFSGASPVAVTSPYIIGTNGIKYCRFHLGGFCRNGENCPYVHEESSYSSLFQQQQQWGAPDLYPSPSNNNLPTLSSSLPEFSPGTSPPLSDSSGSGSGQDNNTPKVCPFFLKGDCRYGDRCRNMHVKLTPNVSNKKKLINEESLEKFSKIPCKYFRQGHCPFGDSCYYLHQDIPSYKNMYQNNIHMYQDDAQNHFM